MNFPRGSKRVCLWGIKQRRFEQKAIYHYTKNYLGEWFPKLPGYQAFSRRLSELAPASQALTEIWLEQLPDGAGFRYAFLCLGILGNVSSGDTSPK